MYRGVRCGWSRVFGPEVIHWKMSLKTYNDQTISKIDLSFPKRTAIHVIPLTTHHQPLYITTPSINHVCLIKTTNHNLIRLIKRTHEHTSPPLSTPPGPLYIASPMDVTIHTFHPPLSGNRTHYCSCPISSSLFVSPRNASSAVTIPVDIDTAAITWSSSQLP